MKKTHKIIASILAIIVLLLSFIIYKKPWLAKYDGTVQIEIIELDNTVVATKKIPFINSDNLSDLLKDNFNNVEINNGMLMGIETLTTPNDWSTYICLYVNDEMSMVGIKDVVLEDNMKISLINTSFTSTNE